MRRTLFLLVALAALTACNPRLYPPQVETPDNYLYAGRFRQDSLAGSEEWWHVFRDPTLDSLISQALANNRDLAVAYSRVEEADRQIAVARAGFLPSFGVGVSAEGDYNAEIRRRAADDVGGVALRCAEKLDAGGTGRAALFAVGLARRDVVADGRGGHDLFPVARLPA